MTSSNPESTSTKKETSGSAEDKVKVIGMSTVPYGRHSRDLFASLMMVSFKNILDAEKLSKKRE